MKALKQINPAGLPHNTASRQHPRRARNVIRRSAVATLLACALTGCTTIRSVNRTIPPPNVLDATLDQLDKQIADQYEAVKSFNASVEIKASVGGSRQGEIKEYPVFAGYILMRKPSDLQIIMQLPVLRSLAIDMVSNGKDFTLLIPPKNKAIVGSDQEVATPSKNGLDNLRPYIIRDALLIPPVAANELVSRTEGVRILPPAPGKKESVEEPDYDLTVNLPGGGIELDTVRVIHISRVTLKPYEQDVYDKSGRLVTKVTYKKYEAFGDVVFPADIVIERPNDEYTLEITVTKMLSVNQPLDDEQFTVKIPEGTPVTKM